LVNKLINSRLGTVFTTDPAVTLWTIIKNNWTNSTGYTVPTQATVKFDTKFGEFKGFFYYVIIENMPTFVTSQILGNSRYLYEDKKRLQILAIGSDAKDKKWKMERHIESIINGNPTLAQTTYGIDVVTISEFTEIPTDETEATTTNLNPTKGFHKARSFATVTLRWEQEATAI